MEDASDLVPGVDYPRTFQEVDEWFRSDAAWPRVYPTFALAERIHLPALRMDRRAVDDVAGAVALPGVPGADVADGWDGLSGHPKAVAHVVHGNVVCHQPKERRQCSGAATCSWPRQLRDGVDLAAQVAPGNGPPWKGRAQWNGRGGRDLCWRCGKRQARQEYRNQGHSCGRRRRER